MFPPVDGDGFVLVEVRPKFRIMHEEEVNVSEL